MANSVALGFKLHTGWAALVAVSGEIGRFAVRLRRRMELLPNDNSVPRFVYHDAAELPEAQAAEMVSRAEAASQAAAQLGIENVLCHLRSLGIEVKAAGIPCGSRPVPHRLPDVLSSHPMIHSAESALFQRAVASSCESCGLEVVSVREREVWLNAATAWGTKEKALRMEVDDMRKSVGAPWGADQKTAAAFALLALASAL